MVRALYNIVSIMVDSFSLTDITFCLLNLHSRQILVAFVRSLRWLLLGVSVLLSMAGIRGSICASCASGSLRGEGSWSISCASQSLLEDYKWLELYNSILEMAIAEGKKNCECALHAASSLPKSRCCQA